MPVWLDVEWLLSAFGVRRNTAMSAYRRFVSEGRNAGLPSDELKRQVFLGDEAFVNAMLARLQDDAALDELTTAHHRPPPKSLEHYANAYRNRDDAIVAAYASGGYNMKTMGEEFGLGYSMISRTIKKEADSSIRT